METRAVVEGALLAGLTVVITLVGFLFPLLGGFLLLLTPLPLIVLAARWSSKLSIIAAVVSAVILMIVNPSLLLVALFFSGLVGVSIGAAFEEQFSPQLVLVVGTVAVLGSFVISLGVSQYLFKVDILEQLTSSLQESMAIYQELGLSPKLINQLSSQLINLIKTTYPSLLLTAALMGAGVNYYFGSKLVNRFTEYQYPPLFFLVKFKLSRVVLIIYILCLFFSGPIWQNIYLLLAFLLTVEGAAVVYDYLQTKEVSKLLVFLVLVLLPVVLQILLIVGLGDIIFDFRNLNKN